MHSVAFKTFRTFTNFKMSRKAVGLLPFRHVALKMLLCYYYVIIKGYYRLWKRFYMDLILFFGETDPAGTNDIWHFFHLLSHSKIFLKFIIHHHHSIYVIMAMGQNSNHSPRGVYSKSLLVLMTALRNQWLEC